MDDFEAPTLQDRIGRLGRYALLSELAEGGMARVFLARRDGSPTPCVLKQLHVELEGHPTAARRFQREAHIIAHMDHPGIARVLGAGLEAGKFCIALEYVAGQTLESVLARSAARGRRLPPPIAVAIATRVLEALAYAHDLRNAEGTPLSLVHRDLSPGNVMIGYDGEVKIIDFGVAQGRVDSFRTAPGMMVGTLRYMSPEQAGAQPDVDRRSDLYTVGVVLYEMLAGQPVVPRGRAVDVLTAILESPIPLLQDSLPEAPDSLQEVMELAMAKQPEDRFSDARRFCDALRDAAAALGRANRSHIGLLVSQLFPDEELAAQRWHDLGPGEHPFGAHDTEDWSTSSTQGPRANGALPVALPPLRSNSLRPGRDDEDPAELRTTLTAPHQLDVTQPDPAEITDWDDFDLRATAKGDHGMGSLDRDTDDAFPASSSALVRPVSDTVAALPTSPSISSVDGLEVELGRLERRVMHLEVAVLALAAASVALAFMSLGR